MTADKITKVGVDLDGVVTYNPFRITRPAVSFIKSAVLHKKEVGFFIPKNRWQKLIYETVIVRASFFPAISTKWLKSYSGQKNIRLILITGRYAFTKQETLNWLTKWGLTSVFDKIYINEKNEQSHVYKERLIRENKLDYYIDDNWDIADFLRTRNLTKVCWIYNFSDRYKRFDYKYASLRKALEAIRDEIGC